MFVCVCLCVCVYVTLVHTISQEGKLEHDVTFGIWMSKKSIVFYGDQTSVMVNRCEIAKALSISQEGKF